MLAFVVLPYAAAVVFVIGTFERYRRYAFTCSSRSSQLLENRLHFWSVVPFHYGLLAVLVGHLVVVLAPQQVLAWNTSPLRLYLLEATGITAGVLALAGFLLVIVRRVRDPMLRMVTSPFDYPVYALLLIQLVTGVGIAVTYRWGSSWFAAVVVPYLRSLFTFQPDATMVASLPPLVRLHIAGTFLLIGIFPFSRLVHVLDVPNGYLWRRPQVVRWRGRRASLHA